MKRSRSKAAAALAAIMISASLSGCYLLPDEEEVLAPPVVKASEVKYSTVTVSKKDLEKRLVCSGTVTAEKQYTLTYEKQGGTSDIDYQITEKELYKKRAELGVSIIIQRKGTQAEIDRAGVEVELIDNELEKLYQRKKDAVLRSPVDGTISQISDVRVGDGVSTGQKIATVIDTTGFYIATKPSDGSAFTVGTKLTVKIGDQEYGGEVFMTPSALRDYKREHADDHEKADDTGIDYAADTFYVRFTEDIPPESVGQLADCILIQESVKDAIVISNNLIKTVDGKQVVYVLKNDEKVAVPVEIGLKTVSQSEIKSGLNVGDEIVIR